MSDFTRGRFSHQFSSFRRQWCQQQSLPFTDVLSAERVQAVLAEEGVRFRRKTFTPVVTLWAFLGQALNPDHSCREAVAHLIAFLVGRGERRCRAGTGAYCDARKKLPERVLARLVRESGDQLHARVASDKLRIAGRAVYVVDGTTVSMPDTAANQTVVIGTWDCCSTGTCMACFDCINCEATIAAADSAWERTIAWSCGNGPTSILDEATGV